MQLVEAVKRVLRRDGLPPLARGDVRLCTFGKLPICADFDLTVGAGKTCAWVVDWVERGHKNSAEAAANAAFAFNLLLSPPGHSSAVVGVIRDSQDQAKRRYPFLVYALIAKSTVRCAMPALVHWLEPVWHLLGRASNDLRALSSQKEFRDYCAHHVIGLPPLWDAERVARQRQDWLAAPTVDWLSGILGSAPAARGAVLLERAGKCLRIARDRPVALRVPLGGSLPVPAQIDFWIDSVRQCGGGSDGQLPTLIFSSEGAKNATSLALLYRDTHAVDFLLLAAPDAASRFIEDLGRLPEKELGPDADQFQQWLAGYPQLALVQRALTRRSEREDGP